MGEFKLANTQDRVVTDTRTDNRLSQTEAVTDGKVRPLADIWNNLLLEVILLKKTSVLYIIVRAMSYMTITKQQKSNDEF
jgi:hypothetical protein